MQDSRKIFQGMIPVMMLIVSLISLSLLAMIVYNVIIHSNVEKYNLTAIVLLITTIGTASFFLIPTYIAHQLGVKEKEMLKEYRGTLDKRIGELNLRFDEQNARFSGIEGSIEDLGAQMKQILSYLRPKRRTRKSQ